MTIAPLGRFVGWFTGRPDHPLHLPLVQQWHLGVKSWKTRGAVCSAIESPKIDRIGKGRERLLVFGARRCSVDFV